MNVTQALAEIKTINARLQKKREFVRAYCARQRVLTDPYEAEGGTPLKIRQELQAITDLQTRVVSLRRAILESNLSTQLTVAGITRSVQDWLTWRREIAGSQEAFVRGILAETQRIRKECLQRGGAVDDNTGSNYDLVIQVSEADFNKAAEDLATVLGELDGALSVSNATTVIEV